MQRRDLLKKIIFTASALGVASIPYIISRLLAPVSYSVFSNHLRPPGALQEENDFIKACIGCGLCGEVCPPKCINFDKHLGGGSVNLPFINPENKGCILCMKCSDICPTKALSKIDRPNVNMGIAQIDRSACYPWVDRGVCGACVEICPLGRNAIKFDFADMYRPVVIEDGCVACGMCVEICPHPSLPIKIVSATTSTVTQHSI